MQRINKVRALLKQNNLDALLVMSPYNRKYLSGFTGTSGAVIVTHENAYLISDFRYKTQATNESSLEFILQEGNELQFIVKFLREKKLNHIGFEGHLVSYNVYDTLSKSFDMEPLTNEIEEIRMIKTHEEIDIIKDACKIADQTYEYILTYIKPGMTEIEVANELEFYMRKHGATMSSFDIIVASGARGALPHGVASQKTIESGDMVTLDFGCYYKGYASDITRAFSVGETNEKLKQIHAIVLEAQLKALNEIKPGLTGQEADKISRDVIENYGYGENFGHSLGHGLGLEVHESPRLSKSSTTILKPGMVVTIEPGIYVEGLGGVRIEDDVLVTEDGVEKLSHSSKELFII